MTTDKQKRAVSFCESWLKIQFTGDINNFKDVSSFLSIYLEEAKPIAEDATSSYYSNFDY